MRTRQIITIQSSVPPIVEVDPRISAWYVRFSRSKIAKTVSEDKPGPVVAIDLDARGGVVGIEILGVRDISISTVLKIARVRAPNIDYSKMRFVKVPSSELQAA